MGGGLLQIVHYGTQDLTLTGNPEITFFNIIFRRYTNFGSNTILLSFDNSPDFNSTSYLNIPKNSGDLISKLILRIKLPILDFTYLNNELLSQTNNIDNNIDIYYQYYQYYISFFNKLKNIINIYFKKYDLLIGSLSYIQDLSTFILKYYNIDEYQQVFLSINYFFNNNVTSQNVKLYNINNYTNATLFKIIDNSLVYIYDQISYQDVSYNMFKFTINSNIDILTELNNIMYNKLLNLLISNNKITVCWVNKIAIYLFNSIELYIGSNKINSLSDIYINNYGNLYYKNIELYDNLIGNNQDINKFNIYHDSTHLYLPIPFWLINNYGLSFPLISLQFNSIQLRINTKKLLECIKINIDSSLQNLQLNNQIINFVLNNSNNILLSNLDINLIVEYIYLDNIERKKFAQSAHEYLIEQVQEIEFDNVNITNNNFQIDFFHCCKDLFWSIIIKNNITDIFNGIIDVFNYTNIVKPVNYNTNIQYIIKYTKLLYIPSTLFNLNDYLNGLYLISSGKYLDKFKFLYNYYSSNFNLLAQNKYNVIILTDTAISLNGIQLISENSNYYNFLHPYTYYNNTPQLGLNVYSFSLHPTEFQPSGSCNLGKINYIIFKLNINKFITTNTLNSNGDIELSNIPNYSLIVQTRNYNVLRLIGGIGATAYTY